MTKTVPPNLTDYWRRISLFVPGVRGRTHVDGGTDGAFHTGTFQRHFERQARSFLDSRRDILLRLTPLDLDGLDSWDEVLGELEAGFEKVGDDNGGAAGRVCCEEGDEPDGSGSATRSQLASRVEGGRGGWGGRRRGKGVEQNLKSSHQMRIGSPSLMLARSIAANATARGSHNAPSSYDTLSGSLWAQPAGWAWKRVRVPW